MSEQPNEYEDKKCRICGYADKENVNIFCKVPMAGFGRSNYGNLFEKITTVYPMVLYEDDPLPKNICKKCANYVSNTYNDIQKVIRQQQRWIENVRSIQPNNKYLSILNSIETSITDTKRQLQLNYNINVKEETLHKLFMRPKTPDSGIKEDEPKPKAFSKQPLVNDNLVKDIQSKLELNGCTIKKVKLHMNPSNTVQNSYCSAEEMKTTSNDENELQYSDDETITLVLTFCQYCPLKFDNVKDFVLHQNSHLVLSTEKVFQKRILPTHLRRGRLITIDGKKSIRCLNCWRIFPDQNATLGHYYRGDCEYYCLICYKEFSEAPKLLREHTMHVHGISYRSAKRQFILIHNSKIQSTTEKSPQERILSMPSIKNSSISKLHASAIARAFHKAKSHTAKAAQHSASPTVCPVCHASFSNWRSRNSHMRKHKPSVKYGEVVIQPNTSKDKYESFYGVSSNKDHWDVPTVRTSQVRLPIRLMKSRMIPSYSKKYMSNDYSTVEPSSTATTTILNKKDFLIKSEPIDEDEKEKQQHHQRMVVDGLVETIIKSEPIEHDNQLMAGLAEANASDDAIINDGDELHCFTCNHVFSDVEELEKHTMFAHNPNFDW